MAWDSNDPIVTPGPIAPTQRVATTPVPKGAGWPMANGVALLPLVQRLEGSSDTAVSRPQGAGHGGAVGRFQILPSTAAGYGFDPAQLTDPAYNTMVAATILNDLNQKYAGNVDAILVAYNSTPKRTARFLAGDPGALLPETQHYLERAHAMLGDDSPPSPHAGGWGGNDPVVAPPPAPSFGATDPIAPPPKGGTGGFWDAVQRLGASALGGAENATAQAMRGGAGLLDVLGQSINRQVQEAGVAPSLVEGGPAIEAPADMLHEAPEGPIMAPRAAPAAAAVERQAAATAPANRSAAESVAYGAGGFAPALAAGVVAPELVPAIFGAQGYNEASTEAAKAGAAPEVAERAGLENAAVMGGLGAIPAGGVIGEAAERAGAPIAAKVAADVLGNAAVGGAMQTGSNIVAQQNYDPNRDISAGVPESALAMGLGAGAIHLIGAGLGAARSYVGERLRTADVQPLAAPATQGMPATTALSDYIGPQEPPGPPGPPSAALGIIGPTGETPALGPDGVPLSAGGQAIPTPGGTRIGGRRGPSAGVETLIPGEGPEAPAAPAPPPAPSPETAGLLEGIPTSYVANAAQDVDEMSAAAPKKFSLFQAIKSLGGIKTRNPDGTPTEGPDVQGALQDVRYPGLRNNKTGMTPERMMQALADADWFGPGVEQPDPATFEEMLKREASGAKVYHPTADTGAQLARRDMLQHDFDASGAAASDDAATQAAKLANWRYQQAQAGSVAGEALRLRADALGVRYDPATTNDDLLADVLEREAIKGEASLNDEDAYERFLDQHLTDADRAHLEGLAREGLAREHGEAGGAEPLPPGAEFEPPTPEGYGEPPPRPGGAGEAAAPAAGEAGRQLAATERDRLANGLFEQTILPGTERSAVQAAAAREGPLRATRPQEEAGGLFAPQAKLEPELFGAGDRVVQSSPTAQQRFTEMRAKRAAIEAEAADLATQGSVRLEHPDGRAHLVGPDMAAPGKFRSTAFTRDGEPWGHEQYGSMQEALVEDLQRGFRPVPREPDRNVMVPPESKEASAKAAAPEPGAGYGARNTVFTKEMADAARKRLLSKFRNQSNVGLDPDLIHDGVLLAGYHAEAGAREFTAWAKAMLEDLGENARPYLRMWYESMRHYPGFDAKGLTPSDKITDRMLEEAAEHVRDRSPHLEPSGEGTAAADLAGSQPLPAAAGEAERGAGSAGAGAAATGAGSENGLGLPDRGAAALGEGSAGGVQPGSPGAFGRAAGGGEPGGGYTARDAGVQPDRIPATDLAVAADDSAHLDPVSQNAHPLAESVDAPPVPHELVEALPTLFPEQRADVAFAEERFGAGKEPGVLFTNGTGTGKTFTGGGVIKRFVDRGKDNILVLAPSQGILSHWAEAMEKLGVPFRVLEDTSRSGKGVVGTTYAALTTNRSLADRDWDLLVADEAHTLSSDQNGSETQALANFRALSLHPDRLQRRAEMRLRDEADRVEALKATLGQSTMGPKFDAWLAARRALDEKIKAMAEPWKSQERPKSIFLSATPFAYDKSVEWGDKYLFDFGPEPQRTGYNAPSARDQFFMRHFGYRMRYNKLTRPDNAVESDVMERQFHEWLRRAGALSGRVLTVDKDYDRKFVLVDDGIGRQIDQALDYLWKNEDPEMRPLRDFMVTNFDYLSRARLLEAIKADHAVDIIKKHQAMGRKVVVFHNYNQGGGFEPFPRPYYVDKESGMESTAPDLMAAYERFLDENPYVRQLNMDVGALPSPLERLQAAFPDALIYNGTVSKGARERAKQVFNQDGSRGNLIIVQSEAGQAGISLHDTTGQHQRVILNLGMPGRPTAAIQQEGRIYRIGQASDAIFRYMNTGTNWERSAFAQTIAQRAGTAENLALGDRARTMREAFINGFLDSAAYPPARGEGKGGKEADRQLAKAVTDFQKAKSFYFAESKKAARRNQREGLDYFPTPEPLGLKMTEWADLRPGDKVLEPSAGHGAIARFFPETLDRTLVEPSRELASRAELSSPGAKVLNERFEDLHPTNKYDGIVMNPPFGSGGAMAMDHLAKAMVHLREGGRIVALLPRGPGADAKLEKLMDSPQAAAFYKAADIALPPSTFERAGTKINAHVVVLEKHTVPGNAPQPVSRDFSNADSIKEFFDRIEHSEIPPRRAPQPPEAEAPPAPAAPARTAARPDMGGFETARTIHGKTGEPLYVASPRARVSKEDYQAALAIAKEHGGYYSSFRGRDAVPGFQFKDEAGRDAFVKAVADASAIQFQREGGEPAPKTVHPLLEVKDLEDPDSAQRRLMMNVETLLKRIAPFAEARPFASMSERGSPDVIFGAEWRDGLRRVIGWSLESPDAIGTARHEAIHSLRAAGVIAADEWSTLARAARDEDWLGRYDVSTHWPDLSPEKQVEEAIAERFADWNREARSALPPAVAAAFSRIRQALQAVGDYLRRTFGKDATAADVFSRIESGEVGARPLGGAREGLSLQREGPEAERARGLITRTLGTGAESVGRQLRVKAQAAIPDPIAEILDRAKMNVSPMGMGSERAQASAKDFANHLRLAANQWATIDKWLVKTFTPEQLRRMWEAADEHGVILRRGEEPGEREGMNRLTGQERATVEELQKRANQAFQMARELGMTDAEGLESYVPRMVVKMTIGGPRVLERASPRQIERGGNLSVTTGQLRHRKYETVEETEAAAQAAFGENAQVVRNIRTLALGTQRLERAVAGRTFVNKIKAMSKDVDAPLVSEAINPGGAAYFTLDHPALQKWGPRFVTDPESGKLVPMRDQAGNIVFDATPIWISREFEGPLKAVLTQPSGAIARALMELKAKMMGVIMYSPLMHNAVIWGKAIPADPRGVLTLGAYRRGGAARKDPALMSEAITAGLDPIGSRYFKQDAAGIAAAEGQDFMPGRSWTAQVLAAIPGLFSEEAGNAVKSAVDKAGDVWHNTFLWDRIADLQMGLYIHMRDQMLNAGEDALSAQRIAAHYANRYAGALPMEGLSQQARFFTNMLFFSRSFTLGNAAIFKDVIAGLPSDVRAQIARDAGRLGLENAQGVARRKATGMLIMDIALSRIGLVLAAGASAWLAGQKPQMPWNNEPGKENRFLIGYQPDGTAIYGRLPTGKVGEEMWDWPTDTRDILLRKLSPYARLMYVMAANDKGFGQKLYDPYDHTPTGFAKNVGRVVWNFAEGVAPTGQLQGLGDMVTGAQDRRTAALQALAPVVGLTISKGAPGGPAMADIYQVKDEQAFRFQEARADIVRQIKAGDVQGARARMTELGVSPGLQNYYVRTALNPSARMSRRAVADFIRAANPDQRARFAADRAAEAARANPGP